MKQLTVFLLFVLFTVSKTSFQIKNINHKINIDTIDAYTKYIKILFAEFQSEDLSSNDQFKKIVQDERISILNTPLQIVLLLVDQIQQDQNIKNRLGNILPLTNLAQIMSKFSLLNMAAFDQETITKKIEQLESTGKIVHIFETSKEIASKIKLPANRKLQQVKPSKTYILKFFFSLMFIFICLAALSTIANMDNKKDTLLYAKFIADVGTR